MSLGNPDRPVGGLAVPTPDGVELRPLGVDDFEAALALISELYGMRDVDPEPLRDRFARLIADVDSVPFLAVARDDPVGLILFRFRRRLNHATFEGWVSDLVVTPAHRRRGIGRALLAAAIAEWRLRGGHQVMLEVAYEREAARALYASAGFADMGKYFEIAPVVVRGVEAAAGVEARAIADTDEDFDATTRLLVELGRPAPTEMGLAALRRTYTQHAARADTASMLALLDGVRVGFISLEFREPFYVGAPQAWIPDLIVAEAARGRHVGALLLDAAFVEARRRGAYAATLESGHQRAVAHRLYVGSGMADVGSFLTLQR